MGVFTGTYFVRYDEELKSPLWKGRIIEELSCGYYLVLLTFCSIPLDSEEEYYRIMNISQMENWEFTSKPE